MSQVARFAALIADEPRELTPAERAARSARLDRLTARFAYSVIAANALIFAGQFIRWALS